jgi:hypothetical protein
MTAAGVLQAGRRLALKWARGRMTPCVDRVGSTPGKHTVAPPGGAL